MVAVLDSRLATAGYRQHLLRGLPPFRRTIDLAEVEAFLSDIRHSAEAPRPPEVRRYQAYVQGLCRFWSRGHDLDQVPAGVIEDGRHNGAEVGGRLGELDAGGEQPLVLGMDVVDGELC